MLYLEIKLAMTSNCCGLKGGPDFQSFLMLSALQFIMAVAIHYNLHEKLNVLYQFPAVE